ncbi:DUF397 domain-containing protein [Kitasatospora sp. LaBMicrA B282]|uniref:DUF397 domain-containing protein n=1 Tax=Kitasatospora sp. LaBMicrA B282 TaxID=3420949 RepID=UPI003D0A5536
MANHAPQPAAPARLAWRTSSYSGAQSNCVQTAPADRAAMAVRDSKDPAGPALVFAAPAWRTFVRSVRDDSLASPAAATRPSR